ncbi:MAG: protein kinase [Subdoligranulum variabile]|jgi:non-specific serine/threonine protein kinase|nr:protein kinase [Subdoligranulum variabile]
MKKRVLNDTWKVLYNLGEKLGSGGNATVFKVTRKSDGKELAIKLLGWRDGEPRRSHSEPFNRFNDEISIMSKSKGTVGVLPIGDFSRRDAWYVMPIATPIMKYIKASDATFDSILSGTIDLSNTLNELHKRNIYHRDIKPQNIYLYNDRFTFGDFGLADFPHKKVHQTKPNQKLGPLFTIAPEMKRYPKSASGEKADVYSFAKTIWTFFSQNDQSFEGRYDYNDTKISLRYCGAFPNQHIVELEELLYQSTSNSPEDRPTMSQFVRQLKSYQETRNFPALQQTREWDFIRNIILPGTKPAIIAWDEISDIYDVLNSLVHTSALNHMLFPTGGGLDLTDVKIADEKGCLKLATGVGKYYDLISPQKLYYVEFRENPNWNYIFIECNHLSPILGYNELGREHLVEDHPNHYVSAKDAVYGVYDYDSGEELPDGYNIVDRFYKGNFLIVPKHGIYNSINSTYMGMHHDMPFPTFNNLIHTLISIYKKADERGYNAVTYIDNYLRKNYIISDHVENQPVHDTRQITSEDYEKVEFSIPLGSQEPFTFAKYYIRLCGNKLEDNFSSIISGEEVCLCIDKLLHPQNALSEPNSVLFWSDCHEAQIAAQKYSEDIRTHLSEKGLALDPSDLYFQVEIKMVAPPKKIFEMEELESCILNADDRKNNTLVINADGSINIISGYCPKQVYPVALETWCAGNKYVGKYSALPSKEIEYIYKLALEGWYHYLNAKHHISVDHMSETISIKELIQKINALTKNVLEQNKAESHIHC